MKITIRDLHFSYSGAVEALRGINLTIDEGASVLMLGHNGAGKSTLLKNLNGILKPTRGEVYLDEINTKSCDVSALAQYVALSFQNPDDQIFSSTVLEEVSFGPRNLSKTNAADLARESLELFRLTDFAAAHPYDLHASKRKMLSLASTVAMDTPIIAFDEPTAGLDLGQRETFARALAELREKKKTIILVTHDIDFGIEFSDSILLLDRAEVVYYGAKVDFAEREDERKLLKKCGVGPPILWRMSRTLGQERVPSSLREFSQLLGEG